MHKNILKRLKKTPVSQVWSPSYPSGYATAADLESGSVVRHEYKQRSFKMALSEQVVEVIPQVIVGPLQTVITVMCVLGVKEKRELESRRVGVEELAHRAQHESMSTIRTAAEWRLVRIEPLGDHVERAHVVVDRLTGETKHAVRERAHMW